MDAIVTTSAESRIENLHGVEPRSSGHVPALDDPSDLPSPREPIAQPNEANTGLDQAMDKSNQEAHVGWRPGWRPSCQSIAEYLSPC